MSLFNFVLLPFGSDFLLLSLSPIYEVMQQNGLEDCIVKSASLLHGCHVCVSFLKLHNEIGY